MDVYVARQPIFDRNMNVLGYELLYRRSINNFYEGFNDNQATAELINNAFLTMHFHELTGGTKAFINFTLDMVIKEIPQLLPKESTVVEVLEGFEISDKLVEACRQLREDGYIIALGDFVHKESNQALIETAHIVKIDFSTTGIDIQRRLIEKYKNKVKFLAEKVETREEYQLALDMGYDYFQGYFFSKPVIIKSKEIDSINMNLIRIMGLLNEKEPDFQKITAIIETDIGLSYKLLKLANSVIFGSINRIQSINHALVQLGITELRKWIFILMLKDIQSIENKELIKNCLIRAKFMELLCVDIGKNESKLDYFLTGMFSSIDVLMNRDMKLIVDELPLTDDVKGALLGENNEIKKMLDIVINYDTLKWDEGEIKKIGDNITQEIFMNRYIKTMMWVMKLDY